MASKPADGYWGKKGRDLNSLFADQRRRVAPGLFNDMDREYRKKFLKANTWTKRDMSYHFFYLWDNPDYRKERLNPLRRIWQAPGEAFERALRPALGLHYAFITKTLLSKFMWGLGFAWYASYYFMYTSNDWTRQGGWTLLTSKPPTMPDNPSYPTPDPKWQRDKDNEYYSRNFNNFPRVNEIKPSIPVKWQ
eukprot:TRINITY_DN33064_c0_g1_i1.p1 TRINITY_DN33064_c0_g1~~TRINITY_DN33064_c0_g1_i1.p1  ORF type:complete len:202 (-),score=34.33 TRINITY_DN33064_c0_g1_i1:377-952(-)